MHNWWIAALEHFGLINRDEAEHISDEIRLTIHKDRYGEAYKELEAILSEKSKDTVHNLGALQNKVMELELKVEELAAQASKKTVASKK